MPIEFNCSSCSSVLRVPEEYAGKQAKCPKCSNVNSIPTASTSAPSSASTPPPNPSPAPTPPQAVPTAPAKPAAATQNPYAVGPGVGATAAAAPSGSIDGRGAAMAYQPLYDAVFFIKFIGWFYIIFGILYCLTIVGIIIAWLFIWGGICMKNAGEAIQAGYPTGNMQQLHRASANLSTVFKIVGVCCMIGVVLTLIYFVFIIIFLMIGATAGAGGF